jgi:hypothetical protein
MLTHRRIPPITKRIPYDILNLLYLTLSRIAANIQGYGVVHYRTV